MCVDREKIIFTIEIDGAHGSAGWDVINDRRELVNNWTMVQFNREYYWFSTHSWVQQSSVESGERNCSIKFTRFDGLCCCRECVLGFSGHSKNIYSILNDVDRWWFNNKSFQSIVIVHARLEFAFCGCCRKKIHTKKATSSSREISMRNIIWSDSFMSMYPIQLIHPLSTQPNRYAEAGMWEFVDVVCTLVVHLTVSGNVQCV